MAVTKIPDPDRFLRLALEILDRQGLMPGPDFSAHKRLRWLQYGRLLSEPRHHRVEAVGTSVKVGKSAWARIDLVEWVCGDGFGNPLVGGADKYARLRDVGCCGQIVSCIRPPVDRSARFAGKRCGIRWVG